MGRLFSFSRFCPSAFQEDSSTHFSNRSFYLQPRHDNTGSELRETKVKYLVYCLEKTIRAGYVSDQKKTKQNPLFPGLTCLPPGHFALLPIALSPRILFY